MKKILFVVPSLKNGGGVIRSLQNFLSVIPNGKFYIDVLSTGYTDSDKVSLQNCNILNGGMVLNAITSKFSLTHGMKHRFTIYMFKIVLNITAKLGIRSTFENLLLKNIAKSYKKYDLVIAFQEGIVTRFVSMMNVPTKAAWIHCDYKQRMNNIKRSELEIYSHFDLINSVSNFTKSNFDEVYPQLKQKSDFIYNFLDVNYIARESEQQVDDINIASSKHLIISIGRISSVKQFTMIPVIINDLLKKGITNFKWILMGVLYDEEEMNIIKSRLEEYNITNEYFEYIGKRMNPYPYIKKSDLLVSLSKSEACPFVVNEARVLGVPVIANNYPSIYEFIHNGVNGYICPNASMSDLMSTLLSDETKLQQLKNNTINNPYSNKEIKEKFLKVLES